MPFLRFVLHLSPTISSSLLGIPSVLSLSLSTDISHFLLLLCSTGPSIIDVDNSVLRLEAPSEAALPSCCFQKESVAFSVGSDGCIRRYDLCSGIHDKVGNHEDLATCVEYSEATDQVITADLDKKIIFSDFHMANRNIGHSMMVGGEVESISVCGLHLLLVIGSTVEMYDLRNLREAVQIKDTTAVAEVP